MGEDSSCAQVAGWEDPFPAEWRLLVDDAPGNLLQCCHSDLKLLTKVCHGRKRREKRMMISYKARMREYEWLKGRLKRAIQSIMGTDMPAVSLVQLVEADPRFLNAPPHRPVRGY